MSMETTCEYCGKPLIVDDIFDANVCQECLDDELNQQLSEEKIVRLRRLREKVDERDWLFDDHDAQSDDGKEDDDFSLFQDDDFEEEREDHDLDFDFDHDYESEE